MNQSGRMERVREALASLLDGKGMQRRKHDAALAEVEEWETRLAKLSLNNSVLFDQWKAAEAEVDRLKAALVAWDERWPDNRIHSATEFKRCHDELAEIIASARAALAPADRNTT